MDVDNSPLCESQHPSTFGQWISKKYLEKDLEN